MANDSKTITIPRTYDEVDADWLTSALSIRHPGVVVTKATRTDEMIGACVKLRVEVEYNDAGKAAHLPGTLIAKGNFGRQGPELDFMFEGEMRSYRDVISKLDINTPTCYFAGGRGGETMLVIEDLGSPDCIFWMVERPLTFDQIGSILDQLAILHSRFWQASELKPGGVHDWMPPTLGPDHMAFLTNILQPDNWAHFRSLPRGVAAPRATASDPSRIHAALVQQEAFHRQAPQTVVHGDSHGANIYFNSTGGGLFDWFLRQGPWFHDVTYLIAGTLDIGDRRRWEWILLQRYLDRLAELGIAAPDLDEAVHCYRRELIFGYVLMMGIGEPGEYWAESAIAAAVNRFAMAAEDHRMMEAIEASGSIW